MKIMDMCEAERPREKLLARGAGSLGDAELLSVLLRSGRPGESAVEMAHRLLGRTGGRLCGLADCDPGYLAALVGPSRAAAIGAAFELGKRFILEARSPAVPLTNALLVYQRMLPRLKGLGHEECWILMLDDGLREIKAQRLAVGGRRATIIDKTMVVRSALENGAASLILVHNHPTGDPRPSKSDIAETAQLHTACAACNIKLQDHIIVADEHFYSFDEEKMY